jgi:GMP synthase (glutamine-hydrolysing)
MTDQRMNPKILLLQARDADDPMADHEHRCFAERTGLPADRVVVHDLCAGPPTLARVRSHAALMIGGAGDYYVSKGNLPNHGAFFDLIHEVIAVGHPTFGSCFGYQCLVSALGGDIVFDPDNTEVGTYPLRLTDEGRADELFGELPERFNAQLGRKDRAVRHPEGVPNLATSAASPFQALRIPGKPIWATQFHPELDRITNADRYRHYLNGYASHMSEEEKAASLERFEESSEASGLLRRFVEIVL